jgi:hypothetical protein
MMAVKTHLLHAKGKAFLKAALMTTILSRHMTLTVTMMSLSQQSQRAIELLLLATTLLAIGLSAIEFKSGQA